MHRDSHMAAESRDARPTSKFPDAAEKYWAPIKGLCEVDRARKSDSVDGEAAGGKSAGVSSVAAVFAAYLSYAELRLPDALSHVYLQLEDVSTRILGPRREMRALIYDDSCHLDDYLHKKISRVIYIRVLVGAKYDLGRFRAINQTCVETSPICGPFSLDEAGMIAGIDIQRAEHLPRPVTNHVGGFSFCKPVLFNISLMWYMDSCGESQSPRNTEYRTVQV